MRVFFLNDNRASATSSSRAAYGDAVTGYPRRYASEAVSARRVTDPLAGCVDVFFTAWGEEKDGVVGRFLFSRYGSASNGGKTGAECCGAKLMTVVVFA